MFPFACPGATWFADCWRTNHSTLKYHLKCKYNHRVLTVGAWLCAGCQFPQQPARCFVWASTSWIIWTPAHGQQQVHIKQDLSPTLIHTADGWSPSYMNLDSSMLYASTILQRLHGSQQLPNRQHLAPDCLARPRSWAAVHHLQDIVALSGNCIRSGQVTAWAEVNILTPPTQSLITAATYSSTPGLGSS